VTRGEIYRTAERLPERGAKPGFYVVVSRQFVLDNQDISTAICAPVYGEILGLATEVAIGPEEGVARTSAIRCDFLMLMFKRKLTTLAGRLTSIKLRELDRALSCALDLKASS
jgi:mRNA-degrading endonuclease toxin of MazEF toxin-antitoxin module